MTTLDKNLKVKGLPVKVTLFIDSPGENLLTIQIKSVRVVGLSLFGALNSMAASQLFGLLSATNFQVTKLHNGVQLRLQ